MFKKLYLFTCIVLISLQLAAQQKLNLITNGKSAYHIVIPENATKIEQEAAMLLQQYVEKISGCTLPIDANLSATASAQIIIGQNKFISEKEIAGLGSDGIVIRKINNSIFLTGGPRKGVLYSVYSFIETYLGCRMYTANVTFIPKQKTITLPASINKKQVPSFAFRMTYFEGAFKNNFCDFHKMNQWLEDWGLWVHSFEKLVPAKKYFDTHPEYFSLVNGKRSTQQLCLTNTAVLALVIDNLRQMMAANPGAIYWSVSQNDNVDFCTCENCKKADATEGSQQGSLLAFVNKVAAQFPDKIITTLAYQYSETPPATIRPLSNVMIMLCTANQERRVPVNKQVTAAFNSNFKKWTTISTHVFIWNYLVQFSNAVSPFPNLYTIQPDIQYFATNGARYLFDQGIGDMPGEFSDLRCYLVAHLMWNKNINIQSTMQDFIKGYYGKNGAVYINQYIQLINKNANAHPVPLRSGGSPVEARNSYLSPDHIATYKNIFNKALIATAGTAYQNRILQEYLPVLFAELEIKKTQFSELKKMSRFNTTQYTELLDAFYAKTKQANIIYLNELRSTKADYYTNYLSAINAK
jgi:hypothetical protein